MRRFIVLMIAIGMLVPMASGCIGGGDDESTTTTPQATSPTVTTPAATLPATTSAPSSTWELYQFDVGDSYTYSIGWQAPELSITGTFSLDFLPSSSKDYKVHFYGTYAGTMTGNFDTIFESDEDEFYQSFSQSVYSSNAMISPIFLFTVVSPWWGPYFEGRELYLGNSWSISVEGNTSAFDIVDTCSHAGLSGYLGRWTFSTSDSVVVFETCMNSDVALPLSTDYRFNGSTPTAFTSELISYST